MRARTLAVSLVAHATAVAAILIAPLLAAPERLPVPTTSLVLVRAAPTPVPEVAPPVAPVRETPSRSPSPAPVAPSPAPVVEPTSIAPPVFAPERVSAPLVGLPGTSLGAGNGPQAPPGSAGATREPYWLGGDVERPRKIVDVPPAYPSIARTAGITGVVILEAVLDESGVVRDVRVLRSIPLLDEAAVTAVQQWRYTPTLLNGEPVPIVMTVTVRFDLN